MRHRTRFSATAHAPSPPETISAHASKQDAIRITDIEMPSSIYGGSTIRSQITVNCHSEFVYPTDADYCIANNLINGYTLDIEVSLVGQSETIQLCLSAPGNTTKSADLYAPTSPGNYSLRVEVLTRNSEQVVASQTRPLTVTGNSGGVEAGTITVAIAEAAAGASAAATARRAMSGARATVFASLKEATPTLAPATVAAALAASAAASWTRCCARSARSIPTSTTPSRARG
ncbi:hypothetical protein [Haloarcula amylovorans]|uniref:hypothetical protein n=1 Tax=Haloarcula amylovorans TaxID=2562280 RepID=UPI0010762FFD|nr:hypothetical protein [Halomicroarcula amylolytica]